MNERRLRRQRARVRRELASLLREAFEAQESLQLQQSVARKVVCSASTVSRALAGHRVSLDLTVDIAKAVGADVDRAAELWQAGDELRQAIHRARGKPRPPRHSPPRHVDSHVDLLAALAILLDSTGTSRRAVARRSGWSPAAVSAALRNKRGLPRQLMLDILRVCEVGDEATALWLGLWRKFAVVDLEARHMRRVAGYKQRWFAQQAAAR
ncbi:MAG TPA: hypothetical protein VKU39_10865 [Streptosporangiaceae bacterium]|nr:hypothetical protein [Streptosporangiaceae bacterium]